MKILKIDNNNPEKSIIQKAIGFLNKGKIIIHPTETVYGLAVDYSNEAGLEKCSALKRRAVDQPSSIMVNSIEQIIRIGGITNDQLIAFLERIFPGPITVLIPRQNKLPIPFWNQFSHLGFRLPNHSISNKLTARLENPVITTSANYSGKPAATKIEEIPLEIKKRVDLILDGGETKEKVASTIIKIDYEPLTIKKVRDGVISWDKIKEHIEYIKVRY